MRVLLLSQYFTPEPVEKWRDLAAGLLDAGHEVEVLTSFPCYPHGKIYEGYRQKLCQVDVIDDVRVVRVPQFPDHSSSALRRAFCYVSFMLSAMTIGLVKTRKPDVILAYQSALPTGIAAWAISRLRRAPYVLDLADLWPESVAASGMLTSPVALGLIRKAVQFVYNGAAEINAITKGYVASLVNLNVLQDKINLVYYWPREGAFEPRRADPEFAEREGLNGGFTVLYAGAIGPCQDLQTVLDAADMLRDAPEVRFVMVGEGTERGRLAREAIERGLTNVKFTGPRSHDDVARMYAHADLLLVHLKPDAMSELSIPSKTFACMASGRPLLMAVKGEAAHLVTQHECGVIATPSSPDSMAAAVRQHRQRPAAERERLASNARRAYTENFCYEVQGPKLIASLERSSHKQRSQGFYARFGKRLFDLAISVPMFLILAPALAVIAVAVRRRLGAPVLFAQQRPGQAEKVFTLLKFRTMTDQVDENGDLLPDEFRLPPFGRWLRSTSLDELPTLWNVIRGDMSLVGPRPLLTEYLERYTAEQARRHAVRPGVTGLAQINGRNALSWEEKFSYDTTYVDSVSLWRDLTILWRTLITVSRRSGVNASGHATMPPFVGTRDRRSDRDEAA